MEEQTREQLQRIKWAIFGTLVGFLILAQVFHYLMQDASPSELLLEGLFGILVSFGAVHFSFRTIHRIYDRLRTSAKESQDIFDSAGDALRLIDANFNIVKINQAMEELTGVSPKDATGMKCFDLLKIPLCGTENCTLRQIQQGKKRVEEEIKVRAADGRTMWIRLVATPSPDPDQVSITEFVQDITERREAIEALEKAKKAYQALVENIADWPWEADTKGRYIFCGPQVKEMLGYEPGELLGRSPIEFLVHPDDIPEFHTRFLELALKKQSMKGVYIRKLHRDGAVKHIETNFTPVLNEKGELLGFRGIDRDITERKRAEEAIRRKNEELDDFVRTVSHDLKTPLTSVQGYASLLAKTADSLDDERRLWLERIQTNAKRMANLINGLLELSRVGRVVGPIGSVSLKDLVADIAREREWKLQNENVELIWADDLPTVTGDRLRLRQVLANLIDNAAKFTGNQPHPRIEIGWQETDRFWEIWVQDNGIGIAPEDQEKVFGLFQRLEKDGTPGTGIGLALVRRVVDYHGGRIWVESEGVPDKGACFHFTLPQNHPRTE